MNDPDIAFQGRTDPNAPHPLLGDAPQTLPWAALLAMSATAFIVIMTETLPAGLLPQLSAGFGVGEAAAGQLISAYALGAVLFAIPAITLTRGWRRKRMLLLAVGGFVVANTITALAPNFTVTLGARFAAGAFSGMVWGMLAGYARKIAPPTLSGKALTVAMAGTPVAFAIGTPVATYLGSVFGWRATFGLMSLITLGLVAWIVAVVPDAAGQHASGRTPLVRVMLLPGVAPIIVVVLGWFLAHNTLYTYISPIIDHTGVSLRVDVVLAIFGVAALTSIAAVGTLADRMLRTLILTGLSSLAIGATLLTFAGNSPMAFVVAVVLWGLSFGGASPLLQTALADASGPDADVANSVLTTAANTAIFLGSGAGGVLLATVGPGSFPIFTLALILGTVTVVAVARRFSFPPGARQ
ncbi:MFS transporter [Rhodococcus sp. G-MC3]|uniref:MFS transporter n=1 Tax=Rhodococcus sp. G-MC3 TaxID=3046209 RepID=UPI0024B988BA|nr:MFS transporter [Rhodococcus sp. G-MC3]MDJ0396673.1 MFS transporter [Rhodococcus sp. G-MC3]